ncbi:MAG: hypothetical protein A2170_03745 [Deltaproteobacteria bacterium RBG_13_53_10]|nr:MAG: hypothetical protein A2170_03745 [Deltaproteobacteria bacterium RBG_13_53_10]
MTMEFDFGRYGVTLVLCVLAVSTQAIGKTGIIKEKSFSINNLKHFIYYQFLLFFTSKYLLFASE